MSEKYSTKELIYFLEGSYAEAPPGMMENVYAKLRAADRLCEAAKEYTARMEKIYAHPSYKGIWGLAYAHGVKYDGPNDVEARAKITKAIADYEEVK